MNCEHAKFLLSFKIDGELGGEESEALGRHLAECAACRQHEGVLRGLQDSLALSQELAQAEAQAAEGELDARWSKVLAGAEAQRSQNREPQPEPATAPERGFQEEGLLWSRVLPLVATVAGLALGAWLFLDAFGTPVTGARRDGRAERAEKVAKDAPSSRGAPVSDSAPTPLSSHQRLHPASGKRRASGPGLVATAFGGGDVEFIYALGEKAICGGRSDDKLPIPARAPSQRR